MVQHWTSYIFHRVGSQLCCIFHSFVLKERSTDSVQAVHSHSRSNTACDSFFTKMTSAHFSLRSLLRWFCAALLAFRAFHVVNMITYVLIGSKNSFALSFFMRILFNHWYSNFEEWFFCWWTAGRIVQFQCTSDTILSTPLGFIVGNMIIGLLWERWRFPPSAFMVIHFVSPSCKTSDTNSIGKIEWEWICLLNRLIYLFVVSLPSCFCKNASSWKEDVNSRLYVYPSFLSSLCEIMHQG